MNAGYTAIFFWARGCFFLYFDFSEFLDNTYVYLIIFLSNTTTPHPQILCLKEKCLSVILASSLLHISHHGGCGVLFENCILMRVSTCWLGNSFFNLISSILDAPTPRKSLILKSECFSCAENMGHFDKSLHLVNKVLSDICESLASPSPRGLWFQHLFFFLSFSSPETGKCDIVGN